MAASLRATEGGRVYFSTNPIIVYFNSSYIIACWIQIYPCSSSNCQCWCLMEIVVRDTLSALHSWPLIYHISKSGHFVVFVLSVLSLTSYSQLACNPLHPQFQFPSYQKQQYDCQRDRSGEKSTRLWQPQRGWQRGDLYFIWINLIVILL